MGPFEETGGGALWIEPGGLTGAAAITLTPLGGGADDRANFLAAVVGAAGKTVHAAGAFHFDTSFVFPANVDTHIVFAPGSSIDTALAGPGDMLFQVVYTLTGVGGSTLHVANTPGSRVITTHHDFAAGTYVMLWEQAGGWPTLFRRQFYQVVSSAPNGAEFDITLDRPVRLKFLTGSVVAPLAAFPKSIIIEGNGLHVTGAAYRAFNFTGAWHVRVRNVNISGTWTGSGLCWDEACYDCWSEGCTSVVPDAGAYMGMAHFTIETSDFCGHRQFTAYGGNGCGVVFSDSTNCEVSSFDVDGCTGDGVRLHAYLQTDTTLGNDECRVRDGVISNAGNCGVCAETSAARTLVDNVFVDHSQYGFIAGASSDGMQLTKCKTRGMTAAGLSVNATATRTTATDCEFGAGTAYGIDAAGDLVARGIAAPLNKYSVRVTGAANVTLDGFAVVGAAGAPVSQIANTGTGTLTTRNGSLYIPAGHTGYRPSSTGGIVRENVAITGGGGGAIGLLADSACTVRDVGQVTDNTAFPLYLNAATPSLKHHTETDALQITLNGGATNAQVSLGAQSGSATSSVAGADWTLTYAQARAEILLPTGAPGVSRNLVVPAIPGMAWDCYNASNADVVVKTPAGTGVTIATTKTARVRCDGTNCVRVTADT